MRNSLFGAATVAAIALAQGAAAQATSPTPNPTLSTIEQRLANLDHDKVEALLQYLGASAPPNLYDCICHSMPHVSNVGVAFNPKTGKCHFAGFGEWELPMYGAPETWHACIGATKYPDGSTLADLIQKGLSDIRAKQTKATPTPTPTGPAPPPTPIALDPNDPCSADKIRFFTDMRMRGYAMNRLQAADQMTVKRIRQANQPGDLPTFAESIGAEKPPADDPAALEKWRKTMLDRYCGSVLNWMKADNPLKLANGVYKYSKALGQFDAAMKTEAEAAIDEIAANQKFVEAELQVIPPAAIALDAIAVANWLTGNKDIGLTGEQITGVDLFIRGAGYLAPEVLTQLLKRSPTARLIAEGIGEMGADFGAKAKQYAAALLKGEEGELGRGVKAIDDLVAGERRELAKTQGALADKAIASFDESVAGQADRAITKADEEAAHAALQDMSKLKPGSPEWNDAVIAFQSNKTAQRLVNGEAYGDDLRSEINKTLKSWYAAADQTTANDLKALLKAKSDEVPELAKRLGMSEEAARNFRADAQKFAKRNNIPIGQAADELEIGAKTITNKRPGADATVSVGRDRDVTFEIRTKSGVAQDIDHVVSEGPYLNGFKQATGVSDEVVEKAGGLYKWAHEDMDQSVTSKWANEAYNPGEVKLDDFLDKGRAPTLTRVEDVRDTIEHKSIEWFQRAKEAADPVQAARNTVEGMRQATKQWKDLILSRANQYGVDAATGVPPRLTVAMNIFDRAAKGKISAGQAEAALRELSTVVEGKVVPYDKAAAVAEMGSFFEAMEKGPGRAYRAVEGDGVASAVKTLAADHGAGWQDQALIKLNDALRNGRIEGEKFVALRSQVLADAVKGMSADAYAQWARSAYAQGLINDAEMKAGAR